MAIFAPSTSPAYSDPYKALTLKALEKRQQDFMNQLAQATAPKAETPMAVAGVGLGAIGDALQKRNMDNALTARRGELASLMAGVDPVKGPTMQQQAQLYGLDPELGAQFMKNQYDTAKDERRYRHEDETLGKTQSFQSGEKALDRSQATSERIAGQEFTSGQNQLNRQQQFDLADQASKLRMQEAVADREFKAVQAELDRATQTGNIQLRAQLEAKLAEAQNKLAMARDAANNAAKAAMPQSTRGATEYDIKNETIPPDQAASARVEASGINKPANVEKRAAQETQYRAFSQQIDELDKATELLGKGINTGPLAGLQTGIANLSGGYLGDKAQAQRTIDFNNIINADTVKRMSETLKGASTDYEMKKFLDIYNNPSSSDDAKWRGLGRLIAAAKADKAVHAQAVRDLGGDPTIVDAELAKAKGSAPQPPAAAGSPGSLLEEAKAAIAGGAPRDKVIERLKAKGVDPTGL